MTDTADIALLIIMAVCVAACITFGVFTALMHLRSRRYAREAARYERMERRRRDLKAQREKDRALAIEWCANKIMDAERARDVAWIARTLRMEAWR